MDTNSSMRTRSSVSLSVRSGPQSNKLLIMDIPSEFEHLSRCSERALGSPSQVNSIDVSFIKQEYNPEAICVAPAYPWGTGSEEGEKDRDFRGEDKDLPKKKKTADLSDFFHVCEICGRNITFKHEYLRHMRMCAENKKMKDFVDANSLKCLMCEKIFSSFQTLRKHAFRHLGLVRFKCKLCDHRAYHRSEVKQHILIHKIDISNCQAYIEDLPAAEHLSPSGANGGENNLLVTFPPGDCLNDAVAKKYINLQTVWVAKAPGKPSEVVKSCQQYIDPSDRFTQVSAEPKNEQIQCDLCQTFVFKRHLQCHVRRCKDKRKLEEITDMNSLLCLLCEKKFSSRQQLKRHAAKHQGVARFKCKICDFAGYYHSQVKQHLTVHKTCEFTNCNSYIIDLDPAT